jgi:hypothetical protein
VAGFLKKVFCPQAHFVAFLLFPTLSPGALNQSAIFARLTKLFANFCLTTGVQIGNGNTQNQQTQGQFALASPLLFPPL